MLTTAFKTLAMFSLAAVAAALALPQQGEPGWGDVPQPPGGPWGPNGGPNDPPIPWGPRPDDPPAHPQPHGPKHHYPPPPGNCYSWCPDVDASSYELSDISGEYNGYDSFTCSYTSGGSCVYGGNGQKISDDNWNNCPQKAIRKC